MEASSPHGEDWVYGVRVGRGVGWGMDYVSNTVKPNETQLALTSQCHVTNTSL